MNPARLSILGILQARILELPFPSPELSVNRSISEIPLNTSGLILIFYMTVYEIILYIPVTL